MPDCKCVCGPGMDLNPNLHGCICSAVHIVAENQTPCTYNMGKPGEGGGHKWRSCSTGEQRKEHLLVRYKTVQNAKMICAMLRGREGQDKSKWVWAGGREATCER
ncbi:Histone H4 [Platysternon megacephalum]|uniref:Histone H4 n=1 Tax=Platysternon megacephalum TaxID=55544 RepID=A0A4D9E374_9SAUR|nr:Histone H4 [Platysternon megacephalum]